VRGQPGLGVQDVVASVEQASGVVEVQAAVDVFRLEDELVLLGVELLALLIARGRMQVPELRER
jgi:hypothetical protein